MRRLGGKQTLHYCQQSERIARLEYHQKIKNGDLTGMEDKIDNIVDEVNRINKTLSRLEGGDEREEKIKKFGLLKKEIRQDKLALIIAGIMVIMTLLNIFSPFLVGVFM